MFPRFRGRVQPPTSTFPVEVKLSRPLGAGQTVEFDLSLSLFLCKEGADGYCARPRAVTLEV